MIPETERALRESIKHWQENAKAKSMNDVSVSPRSCALCQLFFDQFSQCAGCPIVDETGTTLCAKTPYEQAAAARRAENLTTFQKAARAEVKFLKSLLPKEGPATPPTTKKEPRS